jgi:anti-sigma factor RsiW
VVEHLTQKQIEAYSRRQMTAAELLSVTDHLSGCDACQGRIEGAQNGDAAFFDLRSQVFDETTETGAHLTMQQTAAYVDRNLSGEELRIVDDHLSHCHECVLAVADLREFRNEIAPSLDREYRPATVPSTATASRRGIFEVLSAPFRVSPVPAFGGAALAVLLLAMIGWLVWREQQQPEPQIAEAPAPSSQPAAPPSQPESGPTQPQPAPVVVHIVAQINDGQGVLTLDQEGKLSGADNLPPAYQNLLKNALSTGRVERSSQLQGLTRPVSSLMGSAGEAGGFRVIEPLGTVLLSAKPTFSWSAMEGATGYVVEVYDEKFNLVTSSPQLNALNWTTSLPRGNVYSWQVKATKETETVTSPRPPAPQAKFRIVDQAKANELAKARRAYGSSHLTLGLLYAEAGLLREAEQEFRLLQKANPNSDLARNLLRHVQTMRR